MNIEEIKPGDILIKKKKHLHNYSVGCPFIQILYKGKHEYENTFYIKELGSFSNSFYSYDLLFKSYKFPTKKELKLIKLMMIK